MSIVASTLAVTGIAWAAWDSELVGLISPEIRRFSEPSLLLKANTRMLFFTFRYNISSTSLLF